MKVILGTSTYLIEGNDAAARQRSICSQSIYKIQQDKIKANNKASKQSIETNK